MDKGRQVFCVVLQALDKLDENRICLKFFYGLYNLKVTPPVASLRLLGLWVLFSGRAFPQESRTPAPIV